MALSPARVGLFRVGAARANEFALDRPTYHVRPRSCVHRVPCPSVRATWQYCGGVPAIGWATAPVLTSGKDNNCISPTILIFAERGGKCQINAFYSPSDMATL